MSWGDWLENRYNLFLSTVL